MPHLHLYTLEDLAIAVRYDVAKIRFWSCRASMGIKYTPFEIKKRNGTTRIIHAPSLGLKKVQKAIALFLSNYYRPPAMVHGYIKGKSIVSNAEQHVDKHEVLSIDLESFFPSITDKRVYGLLRSQPFNFSDTVATAIVRVCVLPKKYGGGLPQGAPSSNILSNMIALRLDKKLTKLAKSHRAHYTRYADDITFSFKRKLAPTEFIIKTPETLPPQLGAELIHVISSEGFNHNPIKTKLMNNLHCRQRVTGIIVNRKVNVDRRYIRKIRAMIHSLDTKGEAAAYLYHCQRNSMHSRPFARAQNLSTIIRGMISHVRSVRGHDDPIVVKLIKRYNKIIGIKKITLPIPAHCIWKIRNLDTGEHGTAMSLKGLGLVTCKHVLKDATHRYKIENEALGQSHPVSVGTLLPSIDLATLLACPSIKMASLEYEETNISEQGGFVEVYGFQSGGPLSNLSITSSSIRSHDSLLPPDKTATDVTLKGQVHDVGALTSLHLSNEIYEGASGGAVFDPKTKKVIGIIHKGKTSDSLAVAPTIAIPSCYFRALKERQIPFMP